MAIMARENSSLGLRYGVRNAAANACSTCPPLVGRMRLAMSPTRGAQGGQQTTPGGLRGLRGSPASDADGAAPGRADLLRRGGGEGVRVHVDLDAAQVTGAEHLDRLATADRPPPRQGARGDCPA